MTKRKQAFANEVRKTLGVSKGTAKMLVSSMDNLKKGKVGEKFDSKEFEELEEEVALKKAELVIELAVVASFTATDELACRISALESLMGGLLRPRGKIAEKKVEEKEKERSMVETAILLDIKRKRVLADRIQLIMEALV